jgi:hypothetical protein
MSDTVLLIIVCILTVINTLLLVLGWRRGV